MSGISPGTASTLYKSANEFAVDLFQSYLRRHGDKYTNLLLCPYLIYHSLAMMLVGARGETAQQLLRLLHIIKKTPPPQSPQGGVAAAAPSESSSSSSLANNDQLRHKEFLLLTEQLLHGNHDFIHLASFIYLDKSCKRTELFKNILRDYYETKPKKIDFNDSELLVKTINEDVSRTTENIYNDILSKQEALKLEKSMLLVNAVFFRGFWLSNFTDVSKGSFQRNEPKDLRFSPPPVTLSPSAPGTTNRFSNQPQFRPRQLSGAASSSSSMHSVKMMSKLDYLAVISDEHLDARLIKMPFEASDLQMLLILPNDRQSNSGYLCDKITAEKIESIMSEFKRTKQRTVRVTMPIFCIDSGKISIQSTLIMMGASDLFDKTKAQMSGICENKQIWLDKILHRCFIICDNRGSITSSSFEKAKKRHATLMNKQQQQQQNGQPAAASSTTVNNNNDNNAKKLAGIEEFTADHPFMYIIIDSVTNTILLIGLLTDPKETLEVVHEHELSPEEAHQIYTEGVYKT